MLYFQWEFYEFWSARYKPWNPRETSWVTPECSTYWQNQLLCGLVATWYDRIVRSHLASSTAYVCLFTEYGLPFYQHLLVIKNKLCVNCVHVMCRRRDDVRHKALRSVLCFLEGRVCKTLEPRQADDLFHLLEYTSCDQGSWTLLHVHVFKQKRKKNHEQRTVKSTDQSILIHHSKNWRKKVANWTIYMNTCLVGAIFSFRKKKKEKGG